MASGPANAINVSTNGAVSFNGTAFTAGTLSITNGGTNAGSFGTSNGIVTFNGTSLVNYAGPQISTAGVYTNSSQVGFVAALSSNQTNATGNGANYAYICDTVTDNQGSAYNGSTGVFTTPVAGFYLLNTTVYVSNATIASQIQVGLGFAGNPSIQDANTTLNRTAASTDWSATYSVLVRLAASVDVAPRVIVSGESGDTDTIVGGAGNPTRFSGFLLG